MAENLFVTETIEDVRASTWHYIISRPLSFIGLGILPTCVGIYGFLESLGSDVVSFWVSFFIIPVIALVLVGARMQQEFMRQFARVNNFSFSKYGSTDGLNGALFDKGRNRQAYYMVSGAHGTLPIRMFYYKYTTGSGKNEHTYYFTVCEIRYQGALPNIAVEKAGFFNSDLSRSGQVKLNLPAEFEKHFEVSVASGFEIEALEILTPDVLVELIDRTKKFQFEFIDSHIYIYESYIISKRQDLADLHDFAKYIIERLGPRLTRLHDDVEALKVHTG